MVSPTKNTGRSARLLQGRSSGEDQQNQMKEEHTEEELKLAIAAAPRDKDVPFVDVHLGRKWLGVAGVRSADFFMGYQVTFTADDDWRVVLMTSATYDYQKQEVDLAPGRIPKVLEMLKSGDVTGRPMASDCQWDGVVFLDFSSPEKHDEFHNLIGPGYHERLEISETEQVQCSDGEITIVGQAKFRPGEEVACQLYRKYGLPISTGPLRAEIDKKQGYINKLLDRMEKIDEMQEESKE